MDDLSNQQQSQNLPEQVVSPNNEMPQTASFQSGTPPEVRPPITSVYPNNMARTYSADIPITNDSQQRGWLRATAYLPEYFVMLVLLIAIVGAITSLLGIGIDSLIKSEESSRAAISSYSSSYTSGISTFQLVSSLSALLAALPFFAWLFVRTRNSEAETKEIKQHRWRKIFLGGFLVIEGLTVVWAVGDLLYDLIGRAVGDDQGLFSYFGSGGRDPWWQGILVTIITVAVLIFTIFVMSRDYRSRQET